MRDMRVSETVHGTADHRRYSYGPTFFCAG
jgi:hypothetical protein